MSAIAAFYVFPADLLPHLLTAAAVPPRLAPTFTDRLSALFSGRKHAYPQDPYWDLLRTRAEEQTRYEWSGFSFVHLELMLPKGVSVLGGGRSDPDAVRLHELRETSVLFDHDGARGLAEKLRSVDLQPEAVLAALPEELGGNLEGARAVVDALAAARQWLASVRPGTLGLLSLG